MLYWWLMRISSIYIHISHVLAVVVWDEIQDPIYNLSMPLSGIGNRENRSGDPWIGHVSTCYQQLCRRVNSFDFLLDQSGFSFSILMQIFFLGGCASAAIGTRTHTSTRGHGSACRRRPPACRSAQQIPSTMLLPTLASSWGRLQAAEFIRNLGSWYHYVKKLNW